MRLITAKTVSQVLASADVAEIFLAGFRWLEDHKTSVVDRWSMIYRSEPVRRSKGYLRAYPHFERLLNGAMDSPRPSPTLLNDTTFVHLRNLLGQLLAEAESDNEAALAVLALLVAVDERMGRAIRTQYYNSTSGTRSTVPLARDRAMPKPWPAFGTGCTTFDKLAPATGVDGRRLFLEHQFFRVLAPLNLAEQTIPRPALHRSGECASDEDIPSDWIVAAVDVLSTFDELDLGQDDEHFWLPAYSADEVQERVWERLDWALEVCRNAGARLIVAPELTLNRKLVARTVSRLAEWATPRSAGLLPVLVAGRLHEPQRGEPGRFRNRPAVITPDGELAWDYWKMRPFQAAGLGGRWEATGTAPEYLLAIDTPLGRMAVAICLDFLDVRVQAVLRELRASVVVVPAMTPGRTVPEVFYGRSIVMTSESRAATVFANSSLPIRVEIDEDERDRAGGAAVQPRPRILSFVRGSTSIPYGTPMCCDEFDSPESTARVCIYRLHASASGLSVKRDPPTRFPA